MTSPTSADDDLPAEVDFTGGTRGQFFRAQTQPILPVDRNDEQNPEPPGADP